MKQLRLSRRARKHLADIAEYTASTWNADQARLYMSKLDDTVFMLRQMPYAGTKRGEVKRGYRAFPSGEHMIFYRLRSDVLEVVGILHRQMDAKRHL